MAVRKSGQDSGKTGQAPAVGQFGVPSGHAADVHGYRPAGCPSLEQFEARFRLAGDPHGAPRAA